MTIFEPILIVITVVVSAYTLFASIYGLLVILRGRDKAYRQKYRDFLEKQERVESRLQKARESHEGL